MKKIFLTLIFCFSVIYNSYSQENSNFDFIVLVDDVIVTSLNNPKLVIRKENELLSKIDITFKPGDLSLKTVEYNLIKSTNDDLYLKFDYYDYSSGKQKIYNYDIKIGKNWFEKSYIILRVYNTDKKKYKKIFNPIKGTNYTFELDYGGGSMLQIRKK